MEDCEAIHPDGEVCRLDGNHAQHVVGFGKNLRTWPNEFYRPAPPLVSRRLIAEIGRFMREYDSVQDAETPTKG